MGSQAVNPLNQPVPSPVAPPAPGSPVAPVVGIPRQAAAPAALNAPAPLDPNVPAALQNPAVQQVMNNIAQFPMQKGGAVSESQAVGNTVSGNTVSPEFKKQIGQTYDARMNVASKQLEEGNVGAEKLIKAGMLMDEQTKALEEENVKQADLAVDWKKRQDQLSTDIKRKQDAYVEEAKNLDPNRIMTGGNRVLAFLSMASGRISEAFGGKNNSLAIINDAINRDYQMQKDHLSGTREGITLSRQSLMDARAMYNDENAALLQHRSNMKEVFASMQLSLGAQEGSKEAMAKAATEAARTQADAEKDRQAAMQIGAVKNFSQTDQRSRAVAGAQPLTQAEIIATEQARLNLAQDADAAAPQPVDVEEGSKFRSRVAGARDFNREAAKLVAILKDTTGAGGGFDPARRTEVDTIKKRMAVALARANNPTGQISDMDIESARSQIEGGAWTSSTAQQTVKDLAKSTAENMYSQYSLLHPRVQSQQLERFKEAGWDPEFLQIVTTGEATPKGDAAGKAAATTGATPVPQSTTAEPIRHVAPQIRRMAPTR